MKTIQYYLPVLLSLLPLTCQKDAFESLLLSNIIIGEWEQREVIAPSDYGDDQWHIVDTPYVLLKFTEDSDFEFSVGDQLFFSATYSVSDIDSTIQTSEARFPSMKISEFSDNMFVTIAQSREGPHQSKFFKID